jgi:hypothetical protein
VLGEQTQVDCFEKHNSHLPAVYYVGVKKHLLQDRIFDKFVREKFDCKKIIVHSDFKNLKQIYSRNFKFKSCLYRFFVFLNKTHPSVQ